jgi:hypothetical protein
MLSDYNHDILRLVPSIASNSPRREAPPDLSHPRARCLPVDRRCALPLSAAPLPRCWSSGLIVRRGGLDLGATVAQILGCVLVNNCKPIYACEMHEKRTVGNQLKRARQDSPSSTSTACKAALAGKWSRTKYSGQSQFVSMGSWIRLASDIGICEGKVMRSSL